MKFNPIKILLVVLPVLSGTYAGAQEKLVSVAGYSLKPDAAAENRTKSIAADTLRLPVIDDFSSSFPFPSAAIWTDNLAYTGGSFAIAPPTYGAVTLDAIDSTGKLYPEATVESFLADALTSKPVDLFLPGDTTTYLSFYYQPQGYGDAPEPTDSLVVEFYAPATRKWIRVWSTPGTSSHDFKLAMVSITDSRFLQKGFRFRFRNYASLAPAYEPSLKVNADQWNIDYVYLNNDRGYNDTVMRDAALVQPVGSLLSKYTALPWEHFKLAGISNVKAIFQISLNNLSADRRTYAASLRIDPVWSNETGFIKNFATEEIRAFQAINYDLSYNYGFTTQEKDSALFRITLDLNQPATDWLPGNDRVESYQLFSDYYAYDDGSAEAGYGIVGEGSKSARLAYRFTNLNPGDSLQAVDFYFNRSFADAGKKYFRVAVWSDDNNKPGNLIYEQAGAIPAYTGINSFQRILLDTAQVVNGTYYIGWIQTTADFLNVGFDKQANHGSDIFFNTAGTWNASSYQGSLMIRPVFTNKSRKSGAEPTTNPLNVNNQAKIYPNPAKDLVTIECEGQPGNVRVTLSDLSGRILRQLVEQGPACRISVADLPDGIYFISVQPDTGITTRQKIMVLHE